MNGIETVRLLTSGGAVPLATWCGEPLSMPETEAWLAEVRHGAHGPVWQRQHFGARLAELIVRYWSGENARMVYENLLATAGNTANRAWLELCYGQLLLARKQQPAWKHLDSGFEACAHLFEPDEYFVVLKRHQSLRPLELSETASDGATLGDLLREAAVIARLCGKRSRLIDSRLEHQDTVD